MPVPTPAPFLILALPRSRTKWLSTFLSYGRWICTHEEARHLRNLEDVRSWTKLPYNGSVETAVAPFWRLFGTCIPNVRVVVVRRPVEEVASSLNRVLSRKMPGEELLRLIRRWDAKLDQIVRRVPGVLVVSFDALGSEAGARRVFEFALGEPWDPAWWRLLAPVNIQEPFVSFERYATAYLPQLVRMAEIARLESLREIRRGVSLRSEEFEFSDECGETFLRDGEALFAEHASVVGEAPGSFREKNIPLLRALAAQGSLQIITARSNGRMFGYVMSEIAPSRESPNRVGAVMTLTFASRDAPGLGLKLHRVAIEALARKGVSEVWFRAGERGDGARMGTLFRRLGAAPAGSVWKLQLDAEGIL